MDLSGASAIVTGGASGIGAASARALTRRGARCVLVDLNEDLGKQVAAALDGQIGQAAYAASKAGVVGLTLPVARDLSVYGIRVNTIAPGLIDTPMWGQGERADAFKAKVGASVLYPHRFGTPDELASMVAELITNDYMNGETIRVDGGIRMPPR